ncbi:MAG: flavodoxin-dependent (E)-4-hydroxy-3-methylbut-2-enyl-diphosphate synthase [Eubacteriales bacterium]
MNRKMTRTVHVGNVAIGGDAPVAVQSMNTTDTRDAEATVAQIMRLADAGCEITRVAVPDREAALALGEITRRSPIPVVADIHFDYRLALLSIENGAAKIRINPGNLGDESRIIQVADAARARHVPIRVGVNSGSISHAILTKYGGVNRDSMTYSALQAIESLEKAHFYDMVVSIKSSDPLLTIESYRLLSEKTPYPLHVGVTEAGTIKEGIIRSAVGIGALLSEGIGDTIRVSLTSDPVDEVHAAFSILKALSLRKHGVQLISCPTCGRTQVPLIELAEQIEREVADMPYDLRVAVMGCVVNGPGEAQESDIGIAGGVNEFLLFKKGKAVRKIPAEHVVQELISEIRAMGEAQNLEIKKRE